MIPTIEEILSRLISIGADGVDPDQYEYELDVLTEAKAAWEKAQRKLCYEAYIAHCNHGHIKGFSLEEAILNAGKED